MPRIELIAPLALFLIASPAAAQKTSLAVVELAASQDLAGIGARLTAELVAAAAKKPYDIVGPQESSSRLGPNLQKLRECGGKGGCVATWGAALNTSRAVVGSLERSESNYLVKLWLVDLKAGTVISTVDRLVLIASRRLNRDIAAAIPAFLEGKAEVRSKLVIKSNAAGASVVLDGEEIGQVPLTVEAKPGKHIVKISAESYLAIERFVNVEPGKTEEVMLALLLKPGALAPDDRELAARRAEGEGAFACVPAASWIAGGAAVGLAGAGAVLGLLARRLETKAGASSPYSISRSEALRGKREALAANILYGAAGGFLLAGAVLYSVAPRPGSGTPTAAIVPMGSGAVVTLGGVF